MDPVWHRPCCKKTQNGVEIDHIVFAVQTAHFQSLSKAAISLNGMTVMFYLYSSCLLLPV
jgi:transposase-like protein